jgi:hypothetical protein
MPDIFKLKNDEGASDRGVRSASIRIAPDGKQWRLGLEIISGPNEDDYEVILHLKDYPIKGKDPRSEPIRIDIRSDDVMDPRTNLYNMEHNQTEKNRIEIEPAGEGRYRVKWSGEGEDFDDRFQIDCIAKRVKQINYPM